MPWKYLLQTDFFLPFWVNDRTVRKQWRNFSMVWHSINMFCIRCNRFKSAILSINHQTTCFATNDSWGEKLWMNGKSTILLLFHKLQGQCICIHHYWIGFQMTMLSQDWVSFCQKNQILYIHIQAKVYQYQLQAEKNHSF